MYNYCATLNIPQTSKLRLNRHAQDNGGVVQYPDMHAHMSLHDNYELNDWHIRETICHMEEQLILL